MITVALVGADGAGKSTVARQVAARLPVPARYLYMGVNVDAADHVLPTTRAVAWWKRRNGRRPDLAPPTPPPTSPATPLVRRARREVRSWLRTFNWLAEAWFRQLIAWRYARTGHAVICDRHFAVDYVVAAETSGSAEDRRWSRRAHRFALTRLYPSPDLTVVLDVPGAVAWARKGESDVEALSRRSHAYRELARGIPSAQVVDASRSVELVVEDVVRLVMAALGASSLPRAGRSEPGDQMSPMSLRSLETP